MFFSTITLFLNQKKYFYCGFEEFLVIEKLLAVET